MTLPLIVTERLATGSSTNKISNAPAFGSTTNVISSSISGKNSAWWSISRDKLSQGLNVLVDGYRVDDFRLLSEAYAGASVWQTYRSQTFKNEQLVSDSGKIIVSANSTIEKRLAEPLSFYPLNSNAVNEDVYTSINLSSSVRTGVYERKTGDTLIKEEFFDEFYLSVSGSEAQVRYLDNSNREIVQAGSGRILVALGPAAGQRQAAWGDWARTVGGAAPQDPDSIPTIDFVPPNLASDDSGSAIVRRSEGNPGDNNILIFAVRLSRSSSQTVSVNYATTSGGSAGADQDFSPVSGTLTFSPGETTASFSVPIRADYDPEKDEDVFVELSGPTNARFDGPSSSIISLSKIINDDHIKFEPPTNSTIFGDFVSDATFGDGAAVSPGIEIDPDTDRPSSPSAWFAWSATT